MRYGDEKCSMGNIVNYIVIALYGDRQYLVKKEFIGPGLPLRPVLLIMLGRLSNGL